MPNDQKGPSEKVPDDLMWIEDAAKEFSLSRQSLSTAILKRLIGAYRIGADRRTYVSRSEVTRYTQPRAVWP